MSAKTIVVTGGAGFIGSHLCERLVKDGHRVISLDNYFTGKKENNVAGVEYREGHTKDIATLIPETPDIIYHLGEYSRVAKSIEEPKIVFDLTMSGTFAVLEFCRAKKCKIVYAGSSTKMAAPRPDGTSGRGLSPYTWAKASNTDLVHGYGHWYDLPYSIVYFYNVYGPRELSGEYGTVIEIFRQKYLKGEPLPVRKPGDQSRLYTHVYDTVSGIILAGEKGEKDEYNLAAAENYSTLGVAKLFVGDDENNIEWLPERKTSRPSAALDTDTFKIKNLGWKQEHTLANYIEEIKQRK